MKKEMERVEAEFELDGLDEIDIIADQNFERGMEHFYFVYCHDCQQVLYDFPDADEAKHGTHEHDQNEICWGIAENTQAEHMMAFSQPHQVEIYHIDDVPSRAEAEEMLENQILAEADARKEDAAIAAGNAPLATSLLGVHVNHEAISNRFAKR